VGLPPVIRGEDRKPKLSCGPASGWTRVTLATDGRSRSPLGDDGMVSADYRRSGRQRERGFSALSPLWFQR
jgi:hypothetical protein